MEFLSGPHGSAVELLLFIDGKFDRAPRKTEGLCGSNPVPPPAAKRKRVCFRSIQARNSGFKAPKSSIISETRSTNANRLDQHMRRFRPAADWHVVRLSTTGAVGIVYRADRRIPGGMFGGIQRG
jgi:hypothetical protein